jgi:NitT/TauT family transport system ATP-binding protein
MLSIKDILKIYHNSDGYLTALDRVSFDISDGEFVTIFGPNGSGKSTLLNIASGIEASTNGSIYFGEKTREESKIGFVFQNYNESMFPWLSVLDNILFPLDIQKNNRRKSLLKAETILKKIRLWDHRDKYLYQLSGGMRQLVAIARAFIVDPDILLMDEPCSALDYATTKMIEMELLSLWNENKVTTMVVSHDIDEAIFLADRVIIFSPRPGRVKKIIHVDLPRPRNLSMFTSEKFFEIRSKILEVFMYEQES